LLTAAAKVISPYQLHLRLEVTNKTALGIVHRLAGIIARAESSTYDGGQGLASRGQTVARSETWSRQRPSRGPYTIGWNELPWMEFPIQPRRQFLRFVETVREFNCIEDDGRFERLLMMIGTHPVSRCRMVPKRPPGVPMALDFAGPAHNNLERATA
jgi:hypothetical protein